MGTDIEPVTITVDSRESRSGMLARLQRIPGVTVTQAELECADYSVGEDILGVERKSANDFCVSIMDGRIFGQIALIKAKFSHAVVLVEGNLRQVQSAIAPEALDGALSYIALLSGVQILQSHDADHTAALLHRMSLHVTHGLGYDIPLRAAKPKDDGSLHLYLIEGLPGVGPSLAKALLAHFKTPRAVFAATAADLSKVKGFGPKTVARIIEILGH